MSNETVVFVESELKALDKLAQELASCRGNRPILRRAKGSILHDFYNACERIFEVIAREFNGELTDTDRWHKQLLYRMTLPVEGIRPAVISKRLAAELDEYLSFRHLFRNIYGFELESERLDRLVEKFARVVDSFKGEVRKFLRKILRRLPRA